MRGVRSVADVSNPESLSNKLRQKRFAKFESLVEQFPRPLRIIDVGGTESFWEQRGWAGNTDYEITMVNLEATPNRHGNVKSVKGDATNLTDFADREFHVAFSNSVIEHLFTFENQVRMAHEVQRVAKAYWLQTPDYWFPIEPHFHVVGWQWMPKSVRTALIKNFRCGWRGPCATWEEARDAVAEVRLLTAGEMRSLFPDAEMWSEKVFGLSKSIVAYDGFGKKLD